MPEFGIRRIAAADDRAPTHSSDGMPLFFDVHLTLSLGREAIKPRRVRERHFIAVRTPTQEAGTVDKNLKRVRMLSVPPGV
jgi:hypothetical protein